MPLMLFINQWVTVAAAAAGGKGKYDKSIESDYYLYTQTAAAAAVPAKLQGAF